MSQPEDDSSFSIVEYNFPQGSIFGPLLFEICTLELNPQLSHCKSLLYAGGTQVHRSFGEALWSDECNDDLERLYVLLRTHHLQIILI